MLVEHDGRIYVPSGYMTSNLGRLWKQWAVVRIGGTRSERGIEGVHEGPEDAATVSLTALFVPGVGDALEGMLLEFFAINAC